MAAPSQQMYRTEQEHRLTSRHSFLDANPLTPVLGSAPSKRETKQPETHRPARKTSNRQKHQRPARRATATSRHSRARQEFLDSGPTSLPQGSWNMMPAATRPNFQTGPNFQTVVSLDTVFPARDSSLWTVVRLALWLVYGSLAVARLTGLLHSTMNVCVTSETPGWYPALQNNSHIDHTIQMLSHQNLHCLLTVWMVGPWRCNTRVTSATRTRH